MRQTLEARPRSPDPMIPGMGLLMVSKDLRALERALETAAPVRTPGRAHRAIRSRTFAWILALLVSASAVGVAAFETVQARDESGRLEEQLAAVRAEGAESAGQLTAAETANAELRATIAGLQARIAKLEDARIRTVVETETVTETVTEYVPNGKDVTVEITGFDGLVEVYDVRLTHSYGYSDLIGIAENTSGETISYAQVGCSFLDAKGGLLATGMDNKQDWRPGQSWGFVCSADVNATGGILRVDEID
ncbi:MAG TPA: FxLYD domain-containing protein [Actinomycetota bacterium]|nr:FxLYD domain-containing protein [Actinomycetota bacterium]